MQQSEQIDQLATALCKAQINMTEAEKDAKNPYFDSSYATLRSVREASIKALSENNLSVVQTTGISEGRLFLCTTLLHSSGQWIRGFYPIEPEKQNPQGLKSATTYARRAGWESITGVATEDDDGNDATNNQITKKPVSKNDAENFTINFGTKYKGKTFKEIGPIELAKYVTYIEAESAKKNQQPKSDVKAMLEAARVFFSEPQ